jgi:hypothetical protein
VLEKLSNCQVAIHWERILQSVDVAIQAAIRVLSKSTVARTLQEGSLALKPLSVLTSRTKPMRPSSEIWKSSILVLQSLPVSSSRRCVRILPTSSSDIVNSGRQAIRTKPIARRSTKVRAVSANP